MHIPSTVLTCTVARPQALLHPYFHTSPAPTLPLLLPKPKGELVPRELPPEEGGKKRKSLMAGLEESEGRSKSVV